MNISPIKLNTNYYVNFKSFNRNNTVELQRGQYLNSHGNVLNSQETYFFRDDVNWLSFRDYLDSRFAEYPKIDTYVYGCSDGSEPYALSMLLQHKAEKPNRFFPITAIDIEESKIEANIKKKNSFEKQNISCSNIWYLQKAMGITCDSIFGIDYLERYHFDETTTKPVQFRCANILEDIDKIEFKNPTLFICRNMWPYIEPYEYEEFAQKLYEKLPKGSSVIIGRFDYIGTGHPFTNEFPNALKSAGFKQSLTNISTDTPIRNIAFEKN